MAFDTPTQTSTRTNPSQLTALALRGAHQMFDMQLSTMRTLLETQARTAAAFGFPDCSALMNNGAEDRLRQTVSSGTQQWIDTTQRAGDAVNELQQHVGRIIGSQVQAAADTWQQGLEQVGTQTDESLKQLCQTAQQQAEQIERRTQQAGDAARQTMRHGGEQLRQQMQDGAQRGRDSASRAADAQLQQADSANKAAQSANEEKSRRSA